MTKSLLNIIWVVTIQSTKHESGGAGGPQFGQESSTVVGTRSYDDENEFFLKSCETKITFRYRGLWTGIDEDGRRKPPALHEEQPT